MATINPTTKQLIIYRGVSVLLPFTFKQDGEGVDLLSKPVTFHFTKSGSASETLTLITGADANSYGSILTFTDAANGAFHLKITDEQTARFADGMTGTWSFTYESSGNDYLIYKGKFKVVTL